MKSATILVVASGLFAFASAQVYPEVTWRDVDNSTREIWCVQQIGICPNLCQDQGHVNPEYNDCWEEDLHFECVCEGGFRPNLTEYSLTIPYNLCMQSKQECANNCGNNQDCVTLCFSGKSCGASDPRRVNATSTTTTTTSAPTGDATDKADSSKTTDSNDSKATDDPFNNSGMGLSFTELGSAYGVGAMIAGMAIGFFGML